jgi:hypothetical protein
MGKPMPVRLRRLATLVLGMLLACGAHARATVLCVGSAGHFAIEYTGADCCHPDGHADHASRAVGHDDGCGSDCSDTPLGLSAALRAAARVDLLGPACAPLPVAWTAWASTLDDRALSLHTGGVAVAPPRALRTAVNLC